MERPFFSIVTPVSNGEKYLEKTIKSILKSTINDYEYIIVDNISNDNLEKLLRNTLQVSLNLSPRETMECTML